MRDPRDLRGLTEEQIDLLDKARADLVHSKSLESIDYDKGPNGEANKALILEVFTAFGVVKCKAWSPHDYNFQAASVEISEISFRERRGDQILAAKRKGENELQETRQKDRRYWMTTTLQLLALLTAISAIVVAKLWWPQGQNATTSAPNTTRADSVTSKDNISQDTNLHLLASPSARANLTSKDSDSVVFIHKSTK